jgi:hypothetical protein
MRPKNYKYIKYPKPLDKRFGVDWRSPYAKLKINVVGEDTIKRWLYGRFPETRTKDPQVIQKYLVSKYIQLKYHYQIEQYRAKKYVDEINELKKQIKILTRRNNEKYQSRKSYFIYSK